MGTYMFFCLAPHAQCGHLGGQAFNLVSSSLCQVFIMKISLCGFAFTLNTMIECWLDNIF